MSAPDEPTTISVATWHADGTVTVEQWPGCGMCIAMLRHTMGPAKTSAMFDHNKVHPVAEQAEVMILRDEES